MRFGEHGGECSFAHGRVEIRLDEAWRRRMSRLRQLAAAALTWPWHQRYGYRLDLDAGVLRRWTTPGA
ncbi:MAG: hypothetical protein GY856_07925 [bacterium]|nr:hypothetical protein [bacterium]